MSNSKTIPPIRKRENHGGRVRANPEFGREASDNEAREITNQIELA